MAAYPTELERTVGLRSGASVRLRPIRPDDEARLIALYGRLSADTAYQRFFTRMARLPRAWAHHFANVDYRRRLAIVAERGLEAELALIGVARYEAAADGATPEIALVVEDRWQRQGLGSMLLEAILRAGVERGIRDWRADVLAANRPMLELLGRQTDIVRTSTSLGVTEVFFRRRGLRSPGALEASAGTGGDSRMTRRLALIAHANKKVDLVAWATFNRDTLASFALVATWHTTRLLRDKVGLDVEELLSGPEGGDA